MRLGLPTYHVGRSPALAGPMLAHAVSGGMVYSRQYVGVDMVGA